MRRLLSIPLASPFLVLLALALLVPSGCRQGTTTTTELSGGSSNAVTRTPAGTPVVRVRIVENQSSVRLTATANPVFSTDASPTPRPVLMAGQTVAVTLSASGWMLGGAQLGPGVLTLTPRPEGTVAIGGVTYRGTLRFVPLGPPSAGRFDVVNDVDIDAYLKSVVSRELLKDWHPETFRAQAIVARTYALYEVATAGSGRHWDVYDDERSQVYGGLAAESRLSQEAVEATRGVVVTYAASSAPGQDRIFKAYFSSCCGGIGQNPQDAFNDPLYPPLTEKNAGTLCQDSPRYRWGPVTLTKAEVTRRIRLWGNRRDRPEQNLGTVARIQPTHQNRFGRPVRFLITDTKGTRYSLIAEELRTALNAGSEGRTAWSGFMTITDNGPSLTFTGRGSGHAVGMCQYCAQSMARRGFRHEEIVRYSYPGTRLVRAY